MTHFAKEKDRHLMLGLGDLAYFGRKKKKASVEPLVQAVQHRSNG